MAGNPPPGWYPDPNDPNLARYWDGKRWTEYTGPRKGPTGPPSAPPSASAAGAVAPPAAGTVPPPTGESRPWRIEPPKRLGSIAWAAYAVLGLAIFVSLSQILASLHYADTIQTQIDDRSLTYDEAVDAEDIFGIASLLYLLSAIAGAIGFLVWFYRAYSNLPGITGQPLRFGRGWSIGAWFVPILNLWRPKQIGNDIWRGGDRRARSNRDWTSLPVSQLVHWWWALYLLASLLAGIAGGLLSVEPVLSDSASDLLPVEDRPTDSDLEQERAAAILYAASSAIWVIAAVTAIVFVKRASDRQDGVTSEAELQEAAT